MSSIPPTLTIQVLRVTEDVHKAFPGISPAISRLVITTEEEAIAFAQKEMDTYVTNTYRHPVGEPDRNFVATFNQLSWNTSISAWNVTFDLA
jgi:hypothetical protein